MKRLHFGAAILNQTPLDWDGNQRRIVAAIRAARHQQVSVLCLPELSITGYGCEDAFFSGDTCRMALRVLTEVAPETPGIVAAVGLPILVRGTVYNAACLLADGRIAGFVVKRHLAGAGLHYEPRWFKGWPPDARVMLDVAGGGFPAGDLVFDCDGVTIGFEICEDAWVPDRVGHDLAQRGVDVILNPSASHFAFGKHCVRERFVLEGSRAFGVVYVYANLVGNEAGRAIYDGGAMIAAGGQMVARGPRLSFAEWRLTTAVVDVEAARHSRSLDDGREPTLLDSPRAGPPRCVVVPIAFPPATGPAVTAPVPDWEHGPHVKEEEFGRAVALGLFDYLRKSRSRGYVVSLSGGADSAAVAILSALSLTLPWLELGRDELLKRLGHLALPAPPSRPEELIGRLLYCVYQATRHSSATTRQAAQDVAAALHATFHQFDVDQLVRQYVATVSAALGRELTWESDDLALQNIQARVRSPGVWLLANLHGALLLSTSNRSEAAVGYATMDGDTSGGLAPIAGIDKHYLRHWLRWLESTGLAGLGPLPALAAVNAQQPTAELRPAEQHQTDEADLMPYDVLDEIERAAIRDKLGPADVFQLLTASRPAVSAQQRYQWIERFFRLWCRNQWKRERYAPSFHLDDENLDPKTWCRFPILSGGYERELSELRAALPRE